MMLLTVDEVIEIHKRIINATGGSAELRDRGLLESAIYSADASYENVEQYPSVEEKAARLAYGLISNHAFVDGNKRIGVFVMLMTLKLNDIFLVYSQAELIQLGLEAAAGMLRYEEILKWIEKHKTDNNL